MGLGIACQMNPMLCGAIMFNPNRKEVEAEDSQGKYEHLRDLYYRKYRSFSLLRDDEIKHLLVTYYSDTWMELLERMNWYEAKNKETEAEEEIPLAVA